MSGRPSIICQLKHGQALAAADFLRETWNWVMNSWANLTAGDGLQIENQKSDHPKLVLRIEAGDGITIDRAGGKLKISAKKSGDDDDDKSGKKASGGGNGSGSSGAGSDGGGGGSGSGGGSGGGGSGGGGGGTGGGEGSRDGGGNGSGGCNDWSGDGVENGAGDGVTNDGDSCSALNGW